MQKFVCLLFCLVSFYANANDVGESQLVRGAYDLAAPVVFDKTYLTNAVGGQLVFDGASGAFYGLPPNVSPSVDANWVQLSPPSGTNNVVSTGTRRVESATVNCDAASTITNENGDWLASITNISSGQCTITINTGVFGSAPICTINRRGLNGASITFVQLDVTSATNIVSIAAFIASGSSTIAPSTGYDFDLICAGIL